MTRRWKTAVEKTRSGVPLCLRIFICICICICFCRWRGMTRRWKTAVGKDKERCPAAPRCSSLHNAAGNSTTGQGGAPPPPSSIQMTLKPGGRWKSLGLIMFLLPRNFLGPRGPLIEPLPVRPPVRNNFSWAHRWAETLPSGLRDPSNPLQDSIVANF